MDKRSELRKRSSREILTLIRRILGIVFCIALLVFAINAADVATRRMIMCNDDKYALAISLQQDGMLRLDIAGEKLLLDVEPLVNAVRELGAGSQSFRDSMVKYMKSKTGR